MNIPLFYLIQKVNIYYLHFTNFRLPYIFMFVLISEFEKSLFAELIKLNSLTIKERIEEKKIFSNVVCLVDEHYFCPNDELPKTLSSI